MTRLDEFGAAFVDAPAFEPAVDEVLARGRVLRRRRRLTQATAGAAAVVAVAALSTLVSRPATDVRFGDGAVTGPPGGEVDSSPGLQSAVGDPLPLVGEPLLWWLEPAAAQERFSGTLVVTDPDRPCVALDRGSDVLPLAWPRGTSALVDPLHVYGPDLQLLATADTPVELAGTVVTTDGTGGAAFDVSECVGGVSDVLVVASLDQTPAPGRGTLVVTARPRDADVSGHAPLVVRDLAGTVVFQAQVPIAIGVAIRLDPGDYNITLSEQPPCGETVTVTAGASSAAELPWPPDGDCAQTASSPPPPVNSYAELRTDGGVMAAELRITPTTVDALSRADVERILYTPATDDGWAPLHPWSAVLVNRGDTTLCYGAGWQQSRWTGTEWVEIVPLPTGAASFQLKPGAQTEARVPAIAVSSIEIYTTATDFDQLIDQIAFLEPGWYRHAKDLSCNGQGGPSITVESLGEVRG